MDKEFDSNFTDEMSFSTISNDDFHKLTDLPEGMTSSHAISDNKLKKKENQYRGLNNYENNQMSFNSAIPETNEWAWMNQRSFSQEQLREYLLQLHNYLRTNQPELLEVFQERNIGDYEDNERKTPLQFAYNHAICKMDFPGLLYQLAPNMIKYEGGIIMISDDIFAAISDDMPYDDYPGPLSIEKTTEEQIYSYLKDQMSSDMKEANDWDSNDLLINYLELMIKESGKPRPISILRLLNDGFEMKTVNLKNTSRLFDSVSRNSFSRASSRATSRASSRPPSPINTDGTDPELPQNSLDTPQGPGSVSSAVHRALVTVSSEQKRFQNMDKYRQYIMTGRFEEAVHFAATSGIWDHAFALALRMNNPQLTNEVLVKFSRQAITSGDPLYTMHELMAQRPPKIVAANRGFSNSEMGDWRCHLSMIFSVKKYRPEESRQAIEALGEKLSALHNHYAAHLCYLLAGTPFGLDKTATRYRRKFDLIGWQSSTSSIPAQKSNYASCHRLFSGLRYWSTAPDKAIQLTEVFEYALKCADDGRPATLSTHLLPYKYQMVYRKLSRNHLLSAYEYCVDIGRILDCTATQPRDWLQCEAVDFRIVTNIRHLGHRLDAWLRSNDDSLCARDNGPGGWLDNLDTVYRLFCDKYRLWNPDNRKPNFVVNAHDEGQQQQIDDGDEDDEYMSDNYRIGSNGYGRYPDSVASSGFTDHFTDGFQPSPGRKPSMRRVSGHASYPSISGTGQMTSLPTHQQQQQRLDLRLGTLGPLRDIAPPSDLPSEAIMTEPPRFQDHQFYQHQNQLNPMSSVRQMDRTTGSGITPSNLTFDSQRPRYDNQMKVNQQHQQQLAASNKQGESAYHQSMTFGSNRIDSFSMESSIVAKVPRHPAPSAVDEYSGAIDTTPGSIKQPPIGIRNAFVPPSATYGGTDDDDDDESRANCFVGNYSGIGPLVRSRSRSQSNGSVGSGGLRSRNSSDSKEPNHQQLSANVVRKLESTKEEFAESVKPSPSGLIKSPAQQFESTGPSSQPPSAESKGALRGLFSRLIQSKPKEIHLPNDKDQSIMYDETKKRWIDKSNPESEKPLTPPPILTGVGGSQNPPTEMAMNNDPYSPGGPPMNPFINSRYKLATTNVKPRSTVAMVPPAVMNISMTSEQITDSPVVSSQDRHHMSDPLPPQQHQYNYNSIDYGTPSIQHTGGPSVRGAGYHHDQIYLNHNHNMNSLSHGENLRNY